MDSAAALYKLVGLNPPDPVHFVARDITSLGDCFPGLIGVSVASCRPGSDEPLRPPPIILLIVAATDDLSTVTTSVLLP